MYPNNDVAEIAQCTIRNACWEKEIRMKNTDENRAHLSKWKELLTRYGHRSQPPRP